MIARIVRVLVAFLGMASAAHALAADVYVPEALEPWRDWVLAQHPTHACPPLSSDPKIRPCQWTTSLAIDANATGARFAMELEVFAPSDVILPGGPGVWPTDVTVAAVGGSASASAPHAVTDLDGRPRLRAEPGRYAVNGRIAWPKLPEAIAVPARFGLLKVSIDGNTVAQPLVEGGRLWLGRAGAPHAAAPSDSLDVRVFRRVTDGIPLTMETTLDLSVAGTPRVATLGRTLLDGFAVTALESALPARIDPDGGLRVQVEPGSWRVVVRARALAPIDTLTTSATTETWPAQELWGFAAATELRTVTIEGANPVDLSQTSAPFQDLPGYLMTPESSFRMVEQFRGDPNPVPDTYQLMRDAWLAFDGDSLVFQDSLTVNAARPARLAAGFVPGRVTVDDVPQLVTSLRDESRKDDAVDEPRPGIELPQGNHTVYAVSELSREDLDTVVGWHVNAESVATTLHLPPAWRLLWTSGVDSAPTSWLAQWNVWGIFLVTLTTVAAARLFGVATAVLTALTLVVVYHEPGSPRYAWVILLAILAGIRVTRTGRFRGGLGVLYYAGLVVAAASTVVFAVDGFRKAMYPQLEQPYAVIVPQPQAPSFAAERSLKLDGMGGSAAIGEMVTADNYSAPAPPPPPPPQMYPTDLRVQTGPAVPAWQWNVAPLRWDGPVTAEQTYSLTLAPPWLTRMLYVLGPLLLIALLAVFGTANLPSSIRLPPALRRLVPAPGAAASSAALLVVAGLATLLAPPVHSAELPSPALLQQLEKRLIAPPDCMPGCASIERATVRLDDRTLAVELIVNADVPVAVPVLRSNDAWQPAAISRDGAPATATRDDEGRLLVAVPAGRRTVTLTAPVAHLDRFELTFPLLPGTVTTEVSDWDVFGLDEGRLRGRSLQFARAARDGEDRKSAGLRGDAVPPYFTVDRELRFALEWRIATTVRRVAPAAGVVPFRVALLPGEAVLSGQVTSAEGYATGVLAPDQLEQHYESALAQAPLVTLTAPAQDLASERWTLVPSNLWHVEYAGVAPAKTAPGESPGPRFAPLPDETLTVRLTRPEAVPGDSITLTRFNLTEEPGRRSRHSTLTLQILASQGGVYPLALPADAHVLEIFANGQPVPIPQSDGTLPLPVAPGDQTLQVAWESPASIGFRTVTSRPELPGAARNVTLDLTLPADRWPLLVGGPALGPAVTWWGILVLVLLIAVALARVPGLPLKPRDAVVAALGTALCNLPGAVAIAVWLVVMLARRLATPRLQSLSDRGFNALQALLALFSVIAVATFAASVPFGLLGEPEMYVTGNGSTAHALSWYQDQADAGLPEAWVISLPIWIYRLAMLAWSLWLAFALVGWIRWAWESWTAGGAWRRGAEVTSTIGTDPTIPPPPDATGA